MSSPPESRHPSREDRPAKSMDDKTVKSKPLSKMSALARAKAKRAKFLASTMDDDQNRSNTTNDIEKVSSSSSAVSHLPKRVEM